MRLAQHIFSYADQMRFASVSGDHNPMHVDALRARRTPAGAPVVHGIHMLLWAIDSLAAAEPGLAPMRGFRIEFSKFVYPGEPVELIVVERSAASTRLNLCVDGGLRSKLIVRFGAAGADCSEWPDAPHETQPAITEPLDLCLDEIEGRSGRLAFHMRAEDALALFPAAAGWIGPERVAALTATTFLVGMVCPGLHSIYSELSIETCSAPAARHSLAFRVTGTDSRFQTVEQEVAGGGLKGQIRSFVRPRPVEQPALVSLQGLVAPQEFAGCTALIVGGSRGLGELTAKLIAAGGGHAIVTWLSGRDDAERVGEEIRATGGLCETLAYDARKPAAEQLALLETGPSHAYYFATPAIFRPQSEIFLRERFEEFLVVYVEGFWNLAQALRARQPRLSMFYPSSVSVTERPKGMTDYTMAKAAGEVLCADINALLAPMHVTVSRLPRLSTDQTATVAVVESADPVNTMLPIVREVQSWPR